MLSDVAEFVVQGITVEGEIFEPSDWPARLFASLPETGPGGKKDYTQFIKPDVIDGDSSLVVRIALKDAHPQAFAIIKKFITENGLMVRSGRGARDAEQTGKYLAYGKDRRDPKRNTW